MEKDERLLPLPNKNDLQTTIQDYPPAYAPFYDDDFNEGRSIREYFNVVYKRLPIILSLTILTTAVVAFYMYKQPSMYLAETEMIIEPPKPKPQSSKDSVIINNYGDDVKYTNTQLQLLRSHDLMRDVVVSLGLHHDPNLFSEQQKGVISTFRSMFSSEKDDSNKSSLPILTSVTNDDNVAGKISLTPEEKERADNYANILEGGLKVEPQERTNLVSIALQSTKPELAARVTDKMAAVFIEQDIDRETQGAKRAYEDLSKSIVDLEGNINQQTQALLTEQAHEGLPLTSGNQGVNASTLQMLSGQLLAAKDDRRKIEESYNAAVEANSKGQIFATQNGNPAIQNVRGAIAARKEKLNDRILGLTAVIKELNARRSNLLTRYTEEYKEVKAVTEEIRSREADLEATKKESLQSLDQEEAKVKVDVAKEVLTGMRAQLAAAQIRESQLQAAFNAEIASSNRQGIAETKLTTLTRGIETQRQLLDTYTQRQKTTELEIAGSRPDNLKISSNAVTPTSPVGPNRNRNIFIAFLISLTAGIGLAFLLDYLDDSVKSSDDIGRHLGLPTLALIPHQNTNDKRKLSRLTGNNGSAGSLALVAIEDNRSAMAEAYRHLRTSLLFSSAGKPPQTILVTSSQPAEGKTTTAINSAVTLAQSGAEVVIIDCDLRRPRLHSHFGMDNVSGLTNYLSGEKNPAKLLKTFPELPNLKVITSGPLPPNPAELLSSNEMKNLLQYLKGNFKHIIIDSPPAISFTDAAILSTVVDGVILVALAGKSSLHLMRRFKQRLGTLGARIYGVVLNGIKSDSVEYGYYGYGQTYNYYAAADDDSTPLMEEEKAYTSNNTEV